MDFHTCAEDRKLALLESRQTSTPQAMPPRRRRPVRQSVKKGAMLPDTHAAGLTELLRRAPSARLQQDELNYDWPDEFVYEVIQTTTHLLRSGDAMWYALGLRHVS